MKKQKNCIICGKRIRTGYKYCWEHRNSKKVKVDSYGEGEWLMIPIILFAVTGLIIIVGMMLKEAYLFVVKNLFVFGVFLLIPLITIIVLYFWNRRKNES